MTETQTQEKPITIGYMFSDIEHTARSCENAVAQNCILAVMRELKMARATDWCPILVNALSIFARLESQTPAAFVAELAGDLATAATKLPAERENPDDGD